VYYAAVSVDGFIADAQGGVSWLDPFQSAELGYQVFLERVGAVVMGRNTYDQALSFGPWGYPGRRAMIVTTRPLTDLPELAELITPRGFPGALRALKREISGDVWIVGGGKTARIALDAGLVDELELYVVPRMLGNGVPLVAPGLALAPLKTMETKAFSNGVVRHRYVVQA
jgi:dihydrofolate reductase